MAADPLKLESGGARARFIEEEFLAVVPVSPRASLCSTKSLTSPVHGSRTTVIACCLPQTSVWRMFRGSGVLLQCCWAGPVSWMGRSSGCSRYCSTLEMLRLSLLSSDPT